MFGFCDVDFPCNYASVQHRQSLLKWNISIFLQAVFISFSHWEQCCVFLPRRLLIKDCLHFYFDLGYSLFVADYRWVASCFSACDWSFDIWLLIVLFIRIALNSAQEKSIWDKFLLLSWFKLCCTGMLVFLIFKLFFAYEFELIHRVNLFLNKNIEFLWMVMLQKARWYRTISDICWVCICIYFTVCNVSRSVVAIRNYFLSGCFCQILVFNFLFQLFQNYITICSFINGGV